MTGAAASAVSRKPLLLAVLVLSAAVAASPRPPTVRDPTDDEIDDTVTLEALVEPGDDSLRWTGSGAEIEGFVIDIHPPRPAGSCPAPGADAETSSS